MIATVENIETIVTWSSLVGADPEWSRDKERSIIHVAAGLHVTDNVPSSLAHSILSEAPTIPSENFCVDTLSGIVVQRKSWNVARSR